VNDALPGPFLLDSIIGKEIFAVGHLAIPFDDARSVVSHNGNVPVLLDSEAMPILLPGVHLEHTGLETGPNLSLVRCAWIDTRLRDVLGILLHDPIDGLGGSSQKAHNLHILDFHDLFLDCFGFRPGHLLRANCCSEPNCQ
jgi:hypothetical protein